MRYSRARCRIDLVVALLAIATLSLTAVGSAAALSGSKAVVDAGHPDLNKVARGVPMHAQLRLENLYLDRLGEVNVELERFRVFASDSQVSGVRPNRRPPRNAYLRGTIEGLPGSLAVLSFRQRGGIGGFIVIDGRYWTVESRPGEGRLRSRKVDLNQDFQGEPFECLADRLPGARGSNSTITTSSQVTSSKIVGTEAIDTGAATYAARVAVETDWEFLNLFGGDEQAAIDYVGDLFAFASSIYEAEVDTNLEVSYLKLWPGGANDDPWTAGDCTNQLYEFRDYWRDNHGGVERAISHMLSGKSTGCGIAYVGVLCSTTAGYGVSASLDGDFDPANPLPPVWDIIVVSHEIGHNFNSPHTHCYDEIPDPSYPDPVDPCYTGSGCYSGPTDLPAGCPGPGQGCGTIMSYCHLRSGSYGNVAMTFGGSVVDGSSHLYGVMPERVPERMYDHVLSRAASGCLDPVETGSMLSVSKMGAGSGTVTSDDGGIDCGSDCSEVYTAGSSPTVALTSSPDVDSSFMGWSGDADCDDGQVTMGSDMGCTATFDVSCGDNCGPCDSDGICEVGEDCSNCPNDCASGLGPAASCGNGICEAGDGEDCVSCPADCNGKQNGQPGRRFCCGDGDGGGTIPACDGQASACNTNGYQCTSAPVVPGTFCCGDALCEPGEGCGNCALDCQQPVETCGDGVDNDCNAQADCADATCSSDPFFCPTCLPKGESCSQSFECCSGLCEARGNSGLKCR